MTTAETSAIGNVSGFNVTYTGTPGKFDHPFDRPHVRITFIVLYALVFAMCVFGNATVLFVIVRCKRMRSRTNFFLANLAVADLCVGVFCVLPNLATLLSPAWLLGRVMCKLYYFVYHMSYTASISLLTVIAAERYVAIMQPLRSRHLFTKSRLLLAQAGVWCIAFLYNVIYLVVFDITEIPVPGGAVQYCFLTLSHSEMRVLVTVNVALWYALPLLLMAALYTRIASMLWRSSRVPRGPSSRPSSAPHIACRTFQVRVNIPSLTKSKASTSHSYTSHSSDGHSISEVCSPRTMLHREPTGKDAVGQATANKPSLQTTKDCEATAQNGINMQESCARLTALEPTIAAELYEAYKSGGDLESPGSRGDDAPYITNCRMTSRAGLMTRRRVIRLLMAVLVAFAVLVLPNRLLTLLQYWNQEGLSRSLITFLPPIAHLLLYLNSALNPVLYWVFSDTFRRSLREVCSCKKLGGSAIIRSLKRNSSKARSKTGLTSFNVK